MASAHSIEYSDDGKQITCSGTCPITHKRWTLTVDAGQYLLWEAGAMAQDAFPTLTADERELLISGTTAEGWNKLFPPE